MGDSLHDNSFMMQMTDFEQFLLVILASVISACFINVKMLVSAYCHLQNE